MLTSLSLERFTAFDSLQVQFSPGINVFIGANGTGKTHLMKIAYSACDITKSQVGFAHKLVQVFLPSGRALGRLVKRQQGSSRALVEVCRGSRTLRASFSNHATGSDSATIKGSKAWGRREIVSVYIPVKEMLSNAPGFRSLYSQREIHFEEVYADILDRAYRPALRGPTERRRRQLLEILQKEMEGKVQIRNQEFFLRDKRGNLEFTLLAEGLRKLGLLWTLIQNGTLLDGAVLFWDEPETNLNPKLMGALVQIFLELQRDGVQIFLATHDYVILKELDLRRRKGDKLAFHSLYRDSESHSLVCHTAGSYLEIHPNAVAETFSGLYDREVKRSLSGSLE